ncbi:MAG: 3-methyl-2-oxobutanoate hydroxymethyltransferase [Candidatus Tectomicrobia bacterium]|uniref:3-methyl-2-oxobutanoate hydroxymethyltransferase n=1 Tax=Tectimicrobiota bacterium TaxID=2528274 RepID=A0A932CR08_UNCTE|nr:3-methyl-2-oxobutanoate hydroxymethyltransferase [Candidatus Tectomicrobia bacterium]
MEKEKVTVIQIGKWKEAGKKITVLTAYDYPMAKILDQAGIDILLVGDSLGNVILGHANTLPVTMEDMIHHTRAVVRACKQAMVVGDMPFMSYQVSREEAVRNAGRLIKEGGAEAVKLEGGMAVEETIRAIVQCGIPVMGHVGLTPQSIHAFGGHKVQGRGDEAAHRVMEDARAVERAGAFSLVLEGIPRSLAERITQELSIPTIGIGAGPCCDGQVLVSYDLLGFYDDFSPRFVKRYANLQGIIFEAVQAYKDEVEGGLFPTEVHSFK